MVAVATERVPGAWMTSLGRFSLLLAAPLLLARCSATTADLEPIAWQKVPGTGPGGAVLGLGSPGSFDERGNFTISAFKDGDVVRLYYGGADGTGTCPGPNGSHWRIGLATSTDGVNWSRVPGNATGGAILDIGGAGHFDSFLTYRPYVLKDGPIYRMRYNGGIQLPQRDARGEPAHRLRRVHRRGDVHSHERRPGARRDRAPPGPSW